MRRLIGIASPLAPLLGLLLLVAAVPDAARAGPILDQSFDPGPPGPGSLTAGIGAGFDRAQTFTAGLGGRLTRVEVLIERHPLGSSALLFEVRRTAGGAPLEPDGEPLASLVVPASGIAPGRQFVGFDLSPSGLIVAPGDVLAWSLRLPGGDSDYTVFGRIGDPYERGSAFSRGPVPAMWTALGPPGVGSDLGFRTFVDPVVVAEPTGLTLSVIGGLGLLAHPGLWRRRDEPVGFGCDD